MTGSAETITLRQYLVTQLMMNMPNVDHDRAKAAVEELTARERPRWDMDARRTWDEWEATRMEGEKRVSWR